jgi:hypothetical protein
MARHFIVALNLATNGFWWWVLPRHKTHYYDRITDLESGQGVEVKSAYFKVFNERPPAITERHIQLLVQAFTAVPGPTDQSRAQTYGHYLAGLTFMSLSDIHLNFDGQAFGNFLMCLTSMMGEASYFRTDELSQQSIERFLIEKYPALDPVEREAFMRLVSAFEARSAEGNTVKPGDVVLMKLLCETLFRDSIIPATMARLRSRSEEPA